MPSQTDRADAPGAARSPVPLARACVAWLAAACGLAVFPVSPSALVPGVMAALVVLGVVLLARRSPRTAPRWSAGTVLVVVLVLGVVTDAGTAVALGVAPWLGLAAGLAAGAGAAGAVRGRTPGVRRASYGLVLVAFAVLAGAALAEARVVIDVQGFLEGGIDAMRSGTSPYGITIADPYPPDQSALVYGPGVVRDGVVGVGYPYLPVPLLLDLPAHLLGDVRWMHVLAMVVAGAVAWHLSTDVLGRLAALLLVWSSGSVLVVTYYWVEPLLVLLLALTVLALSARRPHWTAVLLGLLLASKQYAVSYLPVLLTVARAAGRRAVVLTLAVAAAVVVPFALWDLDGFVHSAVEFQLVQPFRHDAVSLLPGLQDLLGDLPGWLLALSPVLGLLVSAVVAVRTRPGPTALSLGIGLGLVATVLTSKVGFLNYYAFITAALALATATWPADDPLARADEPQTREPSSQGSRGERGISTTR